MRQPCYPLHHNQPAAQKNFQQSNKTFTRVRDWPRNMISDDTVAAFLLFREISEKVFFQTLTSHFFVFVFDDHFACWYILPLKKELLGCIQLNLQVL